MKESVTKVKENLYVISLDMPNKPDYEWSWEDIEDVAYRAAVSINNLINELAAAKHEATGE